MRSICQGTHKETTACQRKVASFVGQWVPTILITGLYNKLVKVQGSD